MNHVISEKIKCLGFIMTCFMVFYHCGALDNSYAVSVMDGRLNRFISYGFDQMSGLVLSYFFTVTGFLLFKNLSMKNYLSKIKRRVFSLFIPYVSWQVIITLKLILQGNYEFTLKHFLGTTFGFVPWPSDGAMWYVYVVFLLAIISPVLLLIFKNEKIGMCILIIIILLWSIRDSINNPLFISIFRYGYVSNIYWYLPSYLIGAFYGKFHSDFDSQESLVYILLIIFIAFIFRIYDDSFVYDIIVRIMPVLALALLPTFSFLKDKWIYQLTFLMYAIHQPLIFDIRPYIYKIYSIISFPASICNILTRCIILTVDIGLAAIIYISLNKISPKILKILTGGRA